LFILKTALIPEKDVKAVLKFIPWLTKCFLMSIFDAKAEIRKLTTLDLTQTGATVIQVNKEVAEYLLGLNFDSNRSIQKNRVKLYQTMMLDGEWGLGDPIKISVSGRLLDGQHRLSAVPDELVVSFVLLFGQPEKAAETYDQGMRRNALHVAKVRGIEGLQNTHISTLRMMFFYRFTDSRKLSNFGSPAKLVDILDQHPEIKSAIDFSSRYSKRSFSFSFAPIMAAIARAKLSNYPLSDQDLDFFLHVLQGGGMSDYPGATGKSEAAPLLLRNWYLQARTSQATQFGNVFRTQCLFRAQSALMFFSQGKTPKTLKGTEKNVFPVPLLDSMNFKTLQIDRSIEGRK
jgi:hypothetical protein